MSRAECTSATYCYLLAGFLGGLVACCVESLFPPLRVSGGFGAFLTAGICPGLVVNLIEGLDAGGLPGKSRLLGGQ